MKCWLTFAFIVLVQSMYAQHKTGQIDYVLKDTTDKHKIRFELYYPARADGYDQEFAAGSFPVLIVAHGYMLPVTDYMNFVEKLVPLGYIVILSESETGMKPSHENFASDLRYIAGTVNALTYTEGSSLYRRTTGKIGLIGHSMGGGVSVLAAANDTSLFSTMICLAASETKPSAWDTAAYVKIPSLLVSGEGDSVRSPDTYQEPIYRNLASEYKYYVKLKGSGHCDMIGPSTLCSLGDKIYGSEITNSHADTQKYMWAVILPWLKVFMHPGPVYLPELDKVLADTNRYEVQWEAK